MEPMTKENMRNYRARWAKVNAIVDEERKTQTPEDRLRDLNALFVLARKYSWMQSPTIYEPEVRQRWRKLQHMLGKI